MMLRVNMQHMLHSAPLFPFPLRVPEQDHNPLGARTLTIYWVCEPVDARSAFTPSTL
jgi:hypothetical protein